MVERNQTCPLCGSEHVFNNKVIPDHNRHRVAAYKLYLCLKCDFQFVSPERVPSELESLYFPPGSLSHSEAIRLSLPWRVYYSLFRKVGVRPPGKLLDVGCGFGKYLDYMAEKGWAVTGVDEFAENGSGESGPLFPIHYKELSAVGFPSNSFDVITYWWSLEHLPAPVEFLQESFRILKPAGKIVISVPNIASIEARVFGEYWYHLNLPLHFSHFSPATLTMALQKAGFQVQSVRQDPLSLGLVGSLENWLCHRLVPGLSIKSFYWHYLAIPWDLIVAVLGRSSGLITAYATK